MNGNRKEHRGTKEQERRSLETKTTCRKDADLGWNRRREGKEGRTRGDIKEREKEK